MRGETSSQLLENDHIRYAISIRITEAAFERADLASYLPEQAARLAPLVRGTLEQYAVQAADNFLQRPRVQSCGAWPTARRTRRSPRDRRRVPLVSTQGDEVVLDLQPIVLDFAADRGIEDAVASRLPEGAGQFTIMKADQLEAVQNLVNLVRKASALLALIAIGLYGLAIWLARDRRRQAVRSTFISLLFVGVIVLVARKLAGDALIEALAEGDARGDVGDQTWLIATSLMVDLAYALIILVWWGSYAPGCSARPDPRSPFAGCWHPACVTTPLSPTERSRSSTCWSSCGDPPGRGAFSASSSSPPCSSARSSSCAGSARASPGSGPGCSAAAAGADRGRPHRLERLNGRGRAMARAPRDLRPHDGCDLGTEELDRAQDLVVRHRPDGDLEQEALVLEDLVLEEDLLDHLLGAAHEVRPTGSSDAS